MKKHDSHSSDIEYENLLAYCGHHRKIRHVVQDCKILKIHHSNGNLKNQEPRSQKVGIIPPEIVVNNEEHWVEVGNMKFMRLVIYIPSTIFVVPF